MKDFNGNVLSIGDEVAFIPVGYRNLTSGIVVGFTKHKIRIGKKEYDERTIALCDQNRCALPSDLREPSYIALIRKADNTPSE